MLQSPRTMNPIACVTLSAIVSSALAATVGCGGATATAREEASDGGARVEPRPVPAHGSLTEECGGEKGLTGQSVLDAFDVPTSAVFRRFPPEKPYGYTDPATSTRATFRVRYEGGDVRCAPGGATAEDRNPSIILASVAVVVSVDFTTDDGLFDEHVQDQARP